MPARISNIFILRNLIMLKLTTIPAKILFITFGITVAITTNAESNNVVNPVPLNLSPLRDLNTLDNPMGSSYNYHQEFKKLNVNQLHSDMEKLLTTSQSWWPADFGNYGPFFIRLSWHDAGTYRVYDGRGGANRGQQRFSPLNSWPDNVNLDKARQLLWPIKQKYGNELSWSDLIAYAGTVALEDMGLKPIGFAFGRDDDWQGDNTNWGVSPEELSTNIKNGQLTKPFSATQMGLIYVNPEGPDGIPDRQLAAQRIRQAFSGMGMTDEETVALIAGGHTFGKTHGAAPSSKYVGPAPDKAPLEMQGLGWHNSYKSGKGDDTIGSGLEGSWTSTPTKWSHDYFMNLYMLNWKKTIGPGGAHQWTPTNATAEDMVPDAQHKGVFHKPIMFTTDLALKVDPIYNKYAMEFYKNPEKFRQAFANAWFKLTHRDMGPKSRYLGPWIPQQDFIWQDPVPVVNYKQISAADITQLKMELLNSGIPLNELVKTAWLSASTYRKTDYRGGSNGARIALNPEKNWAINQPQQLEKILTKLQSIQQQFNQSKSDGTKVSLADLIVLGGNAAIEKAATNAGYAINLPFTPGRTDATAQQTDIKSINYLQTKADGFINYTDGRDSQAQLPQALVEKASMLNLNIPEMTVLVGGLRVLDANYRDSQLGVLTATPQKLNNAFFVNLLDMATVWEPDNNGNYIGYDRITHKKKYIASPVDLIFGYNSELKAVAQVYAEHGNEQKFINDFASAWNKVMMLGRFDIQN
jgi:catalase-peroxidase